MKKKNILMVAVLITGILTGCDFSEKCRYTGSVEIKTDWQNLFEGDTVPASIQSVFYNTQERPQSYFISGDTVVRDVFATRQQAIFVNHPAGITFRGMDKAETAQAVLPTFTENGVTYTTPAPPLYAYYRELEVLPFETVLCPVVPACCNQQVNFTFSIIRQKDAGDPVRLEGSLGGMTTIYDLHRIEPVLSDGTIRFNAQQTGENQFTQGLRVLGINPAAMGQKQIPKILLLDVLLSDGHQHSARADLTSRFEGFTNRILDCKIDIIIGSLGVEMEITDWRQHQMGDIEIQ